MLKESLKHFPNTVLTADMYMINVKSGQRFTQLGLLVDCFLWFD